MNFEEAQSIVKKNYSASVLKLSEEAIITLAQLYNENTKRHLTDYTVEKLLTMTPYKQSCYIANPFMEFLMDSILSSARAQSVSSVPVTITQQPNPKPDPKPEPKPKPEPEPDDAVPFDLFN